MTRDFRRAALPSVANAFPAAAQCENERIVRAFTGPLAQAKAHITGHRTTWRHVSALQTITEQQRRTTAALLEPVTRISALVPRRNGA